MTLIEAIDSGKPCKRRGTLSWIRPSDPSAGYQTLVVHVDDIRATDWEIDDSDDEVVITPRQFWNAAKTAITCAVRDGGQYPPTRWSYEFFAGELAELLGLGDNQQQL